jgi:N-acetylglucosaminyldiphosphoundecaprenol N-acetyl-beta-D-mannosaminyltransferase
MQLLPTAPRVNILGIGISAIDMRDAIALVHRAIRQRIKGYICVQGMHGIMEAQRDPALREAFNGSLITTPDGMPTVWIGRLHGFHNIRRVFGPDMMLRICEASVTAGYRHFLYGGEPGVAQRLKRALETRYPGITIVGTYTPPFRPLDHDEECDLRERVAAAQPDIIWVGISTPKQDHFMAQHWNKLHATLMIGVGAAFDFHTGRIADAPEWMKTSGLQWLHRLCQDPRRLWKRYLLNIPLFLFKVALQEVGILKYQLPQPTAELSTIKT